jgi:hypothetical protein
VALPDPHKSRAVLVGIGDYTHAGLAAMPAAVTGAAPTARLLREPSIWGLPHEHVTVLGSESTQEQILTAARDAALAAEDTLMVYFAGTDCETGPNAFTWRWSTPITTIRRSAPCPTACSAT